MRLFNIHTHKASPLSNDGYDVLSIVNTYPSNFGEIRNSYPDSYYSCGIHPWYSENGEEQFSLLEQIVQDDKVLAIGEAGLDKLQGPGLDVQMRVFRKHIELAELYEKPLIIHCVKAWDELIALHKEAKSSVPWIIHGYRGNIQQTRSLSLLGFSFSIGEKYNADAIRTIPRGSLFCETDMSEVSILDVYKNIANDLQIDMDELVESVNVNINKSFCKCL